MDRKTAATFLLCLMAVCMMSDTEALGKYSSKTEESSLVTDSSWGSTAKGRTLDGLRLAGGSQKEEVEIQLTSGEQATDEEKAALWGRKLRASWGRKLRASWGRKLRATYGRKLKFSTGG